METPVVMKSTEALEAVTRQEIDITIATAKNYPREILKAREEILHYAKQSREVASSCFYALPRKDKSGKTTTIEGPSVRFAEIVLNAFGNINAATRIVGNDGQKIIAQAVCHDLEKNVRIGVEVSRRITNRDGRPYSEDMQIVTGNAAAAIALRNAIFKVIPAALTTDLQNEIKQFALGTSKEDKKFTERKQKIMTGFTNMTFSNGEKVQEAQVLDLVKTKSLKDVDIDRAFVLLGILNALNEGSATVDNTFGVAPPKGDSQDFDDNTPADGELPLEDKKK